LRFGRRLGTHQSRDRLAVTEDYDIFALLPQIKQPGELRLGLRHADRHQPQLSFFRQLKPKPKHVRPRAIHSSGSVKLETLIHGRSGTIHITGSTFRYQREDGQSIEGEFSYQPLDPGSSSILIDGRSYRVTPGPPGEVTVNGWPITAELFDPRALRSRKNTASSEGRLEITALMPGKVVQLLVSPGDSVETGQGLLVVEAMKMQNEVKSPKAGRVVEVRAKPGAAVAAGEVLLVVE
jgi:biotin carboxyl carrier protein